MIDLLRASDTIDGHTIRAWTGVATDEGVGLISVVEISDFAGRLVCRFEVFLPVRSSLDAAWSGPDRAVAQRLLDHSLRLAREGVATNSLPSLHGHRFEVPSIV